MRKIAGLMPSVTVQCCSSRVSGRHVNSSPAAQRAMMAQSAAVPALRAHLDGCPACREEHESLRALVGGEQAL
jgi:hypothetical protein